MALEANPEALKPYFNVHKMPMQYVFNSTRLHQGYA